MLAQPDSVDTLYRTHHTWLLGLLKTKLPCDARAADIAQDVFVQLIKSPKIFDTSMQARGYIKK